MTAAHETAWTAHTDDLAILLGPGDDYLMAGALLSGATVDLHLAGDFSSDAANITLLPNKSQFSVTKFTSARLAGAIAQAKLEITKPPRVQITSGKWQVDLGEIRLTTFADDFDLGNSAQLQKPSAVLVLAGTATPGKTEIRVLDGSTLSATAKANDNSWTVDPMTLRLTPGKLLEFSGSITTINAIIENTTTTILHASGTTATFPHLSLTGGIRSSSEGHIIDTRLTVTGASLKNDPAGITADGIAIDWPIHLGEGPTPAGKFSVGKIVIGAKTQAAATGTLAMRSGDAWASLDWPAVKGGSVKGSAYINFAGKVTTMDLRAWIPEFDLNDASEIRRFIKTPGSLDIQGRFAADSRFYFDGAKWTNWGSVHGRRRLLCKARNTPPTSPASTATSTSIPSPPSNPSAIKS